MEGTLILSTDTRGRYALSVDGEEHGSLSAGQPMEVWIGGKWIVGRLEYRHDEIYALLGPQTLKDAPRGIGGYYFAGDNGGILGLCAGMQVRLL